MKFIIILMMLEVFTFVKAQDTLQKAEDVIQKAPIDGGVICTQDLCWDGNPRDPLTCECEPQIICDPGPGCGNWLGYPDCKCTACTEDLCIDGSPRDPDTCQCPPCPKPDDCIGEWDEFNCECIFRVCDPIWPPPYPANQWLPYPDCKWTCVPEKCRSDQIWSDKECKCLCKYPKSCSSRKYWDDNECKCKCREPCQDCAKPQIWSESLCGCGCTKEAYAFKKSCNKTLTYWNEQECKCSCWNKPRECCQGKIWSDEVCNCKCEFNCKCAPNFVWDPYTCDCVCPKKLTCLPVNGEVRYFDEGSCSCLCENAKYSRCAFGFDHEKCSCRPEFCTQSAFCVKGYEWDKYQCGCIPTGGFPVCTKI